MSQTNVAAVADQVQKFWSPLFMKELRASTLLPSLVNKDYEGSIQKGGDTVYVSQVNAPTGQNRIVGTDADTYSTEVLSTSRVAITANRRAVAAFEFEDLVDLQSQLSKEKSDIRDALVFAVGKQINDYLYSLVAPSTSAPDHLVNSVSAFDAAAVAANRLLAAQAKWEMSKGWWILADPSYYSDILAASTLVSKDYVGDETPLVGGQLVNKRLGFNILEDNGLAVDQALIFHPDFMHLVMQQSIQFKISDLHPMGKFGYAISADVIYGAGLGINGNKKHILNCASASATSIVIA